ncbi:MAG: hypothetical protein KKF56_05420 [Nanoarchaeota archaeon]|nr:hypothetical protein [Nanoarchaeota archaeon]
MKTINETFEDKEFTLMKKMKKKLSWHDFIILLTQHAQESIKRGDFKIL